MVIYSPTLSPTKGIDIGYPIVKAKSVEGEGRGWGEGRRGSYWERVRGRRKARIGSFCIEVIIILVGL